jgi:hypothetical protein
MKKRRTNPIPLLLAGILCVGLVGYMNSRASGDDKNPQQQQPQAPTNAENAKDLGPKTAAPSKDALKGMVNTGGGPTAGPVPAAGPQFGPPGGRPGGPGGGPGGPPPGMPPGMAAHPGGGAHMPMHPGKPPRPKPSDSSISSGWYMPESNTSVSGN